MPPDGDPAVMFGPRVPIREAFEQAEGAGSGVQRSGAGVAALRSGRGRRQGPVARARGSR